MATSSLQKSFVISSENEAKKLVELYMASLTSPRAKTGIEAAPVSQDLLKEIIDDSRK